MTISLAIRSRIRFLGSPAVFLCAGLFLAGAPAFAQSTGRKPALIRDTSVAEGKEDPEEAKAKVFNPMMAEKSVKIGDFYMKKKNYEAAVQRYQEALEYQPNRIEAIEALGRAYEKQGKAGKIQAVALYKDFLAKNPLSSRAPDFRARLAKLEKQ